MITGKINQELQDILNTAGFSHVSAIDKDTVGAVVDGEMDIFSRDDVVTGMQMSGLRHYGNVMGDWRMIEWIHDDMQKVFELLNL